MVVLSVEKFIFFCVFFFRHCRNPQFSFNNPDTMSRESMILEEPSSKRAKVSHNQQGGLYVKGKRYDGTKRMEIMSNYIDILMEKGRVVPTALSNVSAVGIKFASQFIRDFQAGKPVLDGGRAKRESYRGMYALDNGDEQLLLQLRKKKHQTPLHEYQSGLFQQRGKYVSISTLHRFFESRFPFRGKLKVANQVPIDKFKPENIIRTYEYKRDFAKLNPVNTKFGDECHCRESDAYSRYARVDPLTGDLEPVMVHSNFRNAFTVIGFCGIDPSTFAFDYYLHRGKNSSGHFVDSIKRSIEKGFFKEYDTLILDNASIHRGGEAADFGDWLWIHHKILILFLPTRSPELNPIELLWNYLHQRMRALRREIEGFDDVATDIAAHVLDNICHNDVLKCYKHCVRVN